MPANPPTTAFFPAPLEGFELPDAPAAEADEAPALPLAAAPALELAVREADEATDEREAMAPVSDATAEEAAEEMEEAVELLLDEPPVRVGRVWVQKVVKPARGRIRLGLKSENCESTHPRHPTGPRSRKSPRTRSSATSCRCCKSRRRSAPGRWCWIDSSARAKRRQLSFASCGRICDTHSEG